jgi:ABC-2 type transport system permease protein
MAYGWGLTMLCAVLGVVAINLASGDGKILFYPVEVALGILVFSLLVSVFVSGLGVLISLRAASVRQAQQTFSIAFFAIFVPFFAIPLLPEAWIIKATQVLQSLDYRTLAIAGAIVLLVVDRLWA